jgi:hypothetical protein
MVSTAWENVQAICVGLGFDSRHLHEKKFEKSVVWGCIVVSSGIHL